MTQSLVALRRDLSRHQRRCWRLRPGARTQERGRVTPPRKAWPSRGGSTPRVSFYGRVSLTTVSPHPSLPRGGCELSVSRLGNLTMGPCAQERYIRWAGTGRIFLIGQTLHLHRIRTKTFYRTIRLQVAAAEIYKDPTRRKSIHLWEISS